MAMTKVCNDSMGKKIAILYDGFIPLYRVKLYELLNTMSNNSYTIFHGTPPSNTGFVEYEGAFRFPNVRVRNYEFSFCGRRIIYQPVIKKILFGSYNGVVLGHQIRFVSNIVLLGLFRITKKPVIWWGHGFEKDEDRKFPILSKMTSHVKAWLARTADMFIVYTAGGAEKLCQSGVPKEKILVVRNTIDMEGERRLQKTFVNANPIELRKHNGLRLDSLVLLYVGRIYKEKKVEELLYLVKQINAKKLCESIVEAVIIGSGPDLERVKLLGRNIRGILCEIQHSSAILAVS